MALRWQVAQPKGVSTMPVAGAARFRRAPARPTPTCHYLEYVDWADAILEEPLQVQDGLVRVPDRPGIGLRWRSEAVKALSLDR